MLHRVKDTRHQVASSNCICLCILLVSPCIRSLQKTRFPVSEMFWYLVGVEKKALSLYFFFIFKMVRVRESQPNSQEAGGLGFEENSFCSHCAASQLSPLPSRGGGNTRRYAQWCWRDYRHPC